MSRSISIIIIVLSTLPVAVSAQAVLDTVLRADTVVVVERRTQRGSMPVQSIPLAEHQPPGAISVADAIRYFSGVQVKDYGGIGGLKTVNVRGLGSQHVGLFYDGVQLGNAQNGQIDLGRFSMDNMEAVDLYNGQRGTVFQSARDFASAAAVYLQTRRPTFREGVHDNLRLSFRGGSFGMVNPSALWERRIGEYIDAQLNAEYTSATGRYKFRYRTLNGYDVTDVRRNGDVEALRVEGGLFGRFDNGDWSAKVYFYDSERGYPGYVKAEDAVRFDNGDRQRDRNFFAQSSLRQYFGRYNLMLNAKYSNDRLHYISRPKDGGMQADNTYRQHEVYFSAANELILAQWWRVGLSSDIQYNTLWADLDNFVHPSRLTFLAAAATAFDAGSFRAQASLLYTYVRDETQPHGARAGDRDEWTPTLTASYDVAEGLTLRVFHKRIFRMPTLNDLYYTYVGNRYLDSEYTSQYDLGAVWTRDHAGRLERIAVQIDGYFNSVENKIVAVPGSNQFAWTMTNLGRVEIMGVDAAVQGGLRLGAARIGARLNYTFQEARDITEQKRPGRGRQIPYTPWHSGSAAIDAMWREWELNYGFIYTGERYSDSDNTPENHLRPWYTHDVSISRIFGHWRLTTAVDNIFNRRYEVVRRYPMPGTNFKLKLEWTL